MSTNTDLQQINVFTKGMNTDTSDAHLPAELYRFAQNLRFFTDTDANSGELRQIEGWKVKTRYGADAELLKIATIRDYMIFVERSSNGWSIWATTKNNSNRSLIFGPCIDPIGDDISIVTRYESDKNVKVYIADGKHQIMSVNLIDEDGSFRNYGTDIKSVTGGNTQVPLLPLITSVVSGESGSVKGPVVQYAYTLYKEGGIETGLSPLSKSLSLYDGTKTGYEGQNTNKSVSLSARGYAWVDYSSYKIKIYRLSYVQNGYEPEIALIYDGDFEFPFNYTDTGKDITTISGAEFIALNNITIKPLLIESKNDYLFAANINYEEQEVDDIFEECTAEYSAVTKQQYKYKLNIDGTIKLGDYFPSFKRGETYRFGIIFYDKEGRRSSVKCIGDVLVPEGDDPFEVKNDDGLYIEVNPITISVVVNIPEEIKDKCAGYEIVRCKRSIGDSKCITLGIIGRALQNTDDQIRGNDRIAYSYMTMSNIINVGTETNGKPYQTCEDLMMFASPEYVYLADDVKNALDYYKSSIKLELQRNYEIPNAGVRFLGKSTGPNRWVTDGNSTRPAQYGRGTYNAKGHNGYVVGDSEFILGLVKGGSDDDMFSEYSPYGYGFYRDGLSLYSTPAFAIARDSYDIMSDSPDGHEENYHAWRTQFQTRNTERKVNFSLLYPTKSVGSYNNAKYDIDNIAYTESPNPNKFDDGTNILINNDRTVCGTLEFINWDAVDVYSEKGRYNSDSNAAKDFSNPDYWYWYAASSGKKCMLLKTNIRHYSIDAIAPITVASIINDSVIPYGGNSDIAKSQSVFYSFGDYHTASAENTHDLRTGDTYLSMFEYNSAHCWDSAQNRARMYPTVYMVPIESSIDLMATWGDLYSRLTSQYKYYMLDIPSSVRNFSQEKYAYLYNTAYSMIPEIIAFTKSQYNSIYSDNYDCRVYYSNLKTNGETIDSWLKFKSANFIDVDTRFGQITQMKLFKDTLVFWQKQATGVLSVNERTLIKDANTTNIILGNGDVLQRYDYLTTEYGMKAGDKSDVQSNNALYWWDSSKKDILQYAGGNQVIPLKVNKTVSNYINTITNFAKRPKAEYDSKYQEIMFNISSDGPLVYNELIQQFTGVYTRPFDHSARFSDYMLLFNGLYAYEWNTKGVDFPVLLKYVVNKNSTYTKTFDNLQFGMGELFMFDHFYNGEIDDTTKKTNRKLKFTFKTPLKQESSTTLDITNREYDLRMPIPRANDNQAYGGRMRGRTMLCEISTDTNSNLNFSLQYIITKFRISWS